MKHYFDFKKNIHLTLLFLLCAVILVSHTLYVIKTHHYPQQDEHIYLDFALRFYDLWRTPSIEHFNQIMEINPYRQPLYGVFLSIPLLFVGTAYAYKTALWFNGIFYIVTAVTIYFLAKEFLSRRASLLAAMMFSFYGFPLFYLHFTYSETAATTFVVLSLFFLARSKYFSQIKNTLLFSLFFTLGALTKWVVLVFVSGALLYSFAVAVYLQTKKKQKNLKKFFSNIGVFLTIGILPILFLYYIPRFAYLLDYFSSQAKNSPQWVTKLTNLPPGLENTFSVHSVMFYFNILSQQTVFFFALFGVGCLLSLRFIKKYAFLVAGFWVAYIAFTFVSVWKGDRFIVPIYPLMAVISAITFDHIQNVRLRNVIIGLAVIIGFFNFLGSSWAIGPMGQQGLKDIVLPEFIRHPRRIYLTSIVWPPTREELNANKMAETIGNDFSDTSRKPMILLTFEYHPYNNALYTISVYEKRSQFLFQPMRDIDYNRFFELLDQADYVLVKDEKPIDVYFSKENSPELYNAVRVEREFNNVWKMSKGNFHLPLKVIKKVPLPLDGTNMILYKKIGKITNEQWEKFIQLLIQANPESEKELESVAMNGLHTITKSCKKISIIRSMLVEKGTDNTSNAWIRPHT